MLPSSIPGPSTGAIFTPTSFLPPSRVQTSETVPANTSTAIPGVDPTPMTIPARTPSHLPLTLSCMSDQPSSPSPFRQAPLSRTSHSDHGDADGWPPQHTPTWELGPQHPPYVHAAEAYLIGVPGGPKWRSLLERWVIYKSLSSSNPVRVFYSRFSFLLIFILTGIRKATK